MLEYELIPEATCFNRLYSYLGFPLQQVTGKSKNDVRVDKDRTQVYDAGVGLSGSGGSR